MKRTCINVPIHSCKSMWPVVSLVLYCMLQKSAKFWLRVTATPQTVPPPPPQPHSRRNAADFTPHYLPLTLWSLSRPRANPPAPAEATVGPAVCLVVTRLLPRWVVLALSRALWNSSSAQPRGAGPAPPAGVPLRNQMWELDPTKALPWEKCHLQRRHRAIRSPLYRKRNPPWQFQLRRDNRKGNVGDLESTLLKKQQRRRRN